jgi:starch phosphorylase
MLYSALTIGRLEDIFLLIKMAEEMGKENIFIFGMIVEEVEKLQAVGYNAMDFYNSNLELKQVQFSLQQQPAITGAILTAAATRS